MGLVGRVGRAAVVLLMGRRAQRTWSERARRRRVRRRAVLSSRTRARVDARVCI